MTAAGEGQALVSESEPAELSRGAAMAPQVFEASEAVGRAQGAASATMEGSVPAAALVAARAADAKLGEDTVVLAMGDLLVVTDAFVITSGRNTRQVKTIVDEVERAVKAESGRSPRRVEGLRDQHWVLMDYGDFLVHVFLDETRAYYDLERLWGNAPRVSWRDPVGAPPPA